MFRNEKRSHVAIWNWIQRFGSLKFLYYFLGVSKVILLFYSLLIVLSISNLLYRNFFISKLIDLLHFCICNGEI
jgi:hypothetical protein